MFTFEKSLCYLLYVLIVRAFHCIHQNFKFQCKYFHLILKKKKSGISAGFTLLFCKYMSISLR